MDETEVYFTDPANPDTDGDGATDGEEVFNETDPLVLDGDDQNGESQAPPAPANATVVLEVTGSGEVYAIWSDPFGQVASDHTKMPFSKSFTLPADENYVALTWTSRDDAPKGCKITVDNKVVVEKPLGTADNCVFTR
jgi:hypothetical protein